MNGSGKCTYPNGDRYEGSFQNNQRHGRGVYVFANGTRSQGRWSNGNPPPVKPSPPKPRAKPTKR
jgi:hypothetical protein